MRLLAVFFVLLSFSLSAKPVMKEFKIVDEFDSYLEELDAIKTIDVYTIDMEFDDGEQVYVRIQGKAGEKKFNKVFNKRFLKGKTKINFDISLAFKSSAGEDCSNITEIGYNLKFTYSRLTNKFNDDQTLVVTRQVIEQCIPPYDVVAVAETQKLDVEISPLIEEKEDVNLITQEMMTAFVVADEHDPLIQEKAAPKRVEIVNMTVLYESPFYVFVHIEGSVDKKDISGIHQFSKRDGRITKAIHSVNVPSMHGYCGSTQDFIYRLSFLMDERQITDLQLSVTYQDLQDACHPPFEPKQTLNINKVEL